MGSDKNECVLQGSIVAVVTPMHSDGGIDFESYDALLQWHIDNGTDGVVVAGTTGEAPTLDTAEQLHLIEHTIAFVAQRMPVIAGVGANATAEAVHLTVAAYELGADAGLSVVPYYNKPSQLGLYQHFATIAQSSPLPLILYNVPGRTITDIDNDTIIQLQQFETIRGVKDATGDATRLAYLQQHGKRDFILLSGDDKTFFDYLCGGGHGVISVTSNVAPDAMSRICADVRRGDIESARERNNTLADFHQHQGIEANPIPVKWALWRMGKIPNGIRLPLTTLDSHYQETILNCLQQCGIEI